MNTNAANPSVYTSDDVAGIRLLQAAAAKREEAERLTGAAPDLLAALQALVDYCQTPRHRAEGVARAPRQRDLDAARAAIAKATGA